MTSDQLQQLIQAGESLDLEFKGEERAPLNDRAIFEQAVCFANSEGGTLLIGVEDDRRITGARPRHGNTTEPAKLQAAIFNNTEPRINSRVSVISINGLSIIAVEVDPYPEICATKSGTALRRVMAADGPQCVPFYPHEHVSRRVNLGLLDYTAQSPSDARWEDLDSLAFERTRQTITALRGDAALLSLSDIELAQALHQGIMPLGCSPEWWTKVNWCVWVLPPDGSTTRSREVPNEQTGRFFQLYKRAYTRRL